MTRAKVEFQPLLALTRLDTGDLWHGLRVAFSVPGSPHALLEIPDDWTTQETADLFDAWVTTGELVDWRYEHTDYQLLGWVESPAVRPLFSTGDTFLLHGLTAAVIERGSFGEGVMVGICDTGIDSRHAHFAGVTVIGEGKDRDGHGHGTHCASTAAGLMGIAPNASIYAGWALPQGGSGTEADVASSIRAAADAGCKVISLSLGGSVSQVMDSACEYAKTKGAVVCVAAGNAGGAPIGSPARAADLIVMAHDRSRTWAGFTDGRNWANPNRIGFNGVQIRAAQAGSGSGTVEMSGTSMACPHAAGVATLLAAAGLSRTSIVQYMLDHRATPPEGPGSELVLLDFGFVPPPEEPVEDIRMIDFRSQIRNPTGSGPMNPSPGIALHHTAVVTPQDGSPHAVDAQFAQPLSTWSQEQEEQHIRNIDAGHSASPDIGLFAYHVMVFPSGRSYHCGNLNGRRAHIKDRNHEFVGLCVAGDFTQQSLTPTLEAGIRHAIAEIHKTYPQAVVAGHGQLAVPSSPTACPGTLVNTDWNSAPPVEPDDHVVRVWEQQGHLIIEFASGDTWPLRIASQDGTRVFEIAAP